MSISLYEQFLDLTIGVWKRWIMNRNFLAHIILNQNSIKLCVIDAWTETYQFSSFSLFFFSGQPLHSKEMLG